MFRKIELPVLAVFLAIMAVLPAAQAQDKKSDQSDASAGAPPKVAATTDPNYVIGAQDVVDISVWKEAELSHSVPVRPDGKISLPLLNDVQAAGLTPQQLSAEITTGLKKYITDPQVTVIITTINSQRIYILGEVNHAGAYPLLPNMTALEALSSGGGFTPFASVKKIYILRMEDGKQVKYPLNYKEVIAGKAPQENITLRAGDTVVVP